jgi:hypothetical protein
MWASKFYFYNKETKEFEINKTNLNSISRFAIFRTIDIANIEFLETINPNGMVFTATDNSRGRKMLYDRFSLSVKDKLGYEYITEYDEDIDAQIYILYKDIDLNSVTDAVSEFIKSF